MPAAHVGPGRGIHRLYEGAVAAPDGVIGLRRYLLRAPVVDLNIVACRVFDEISVSVGFETLDRERIVCRRVAEAGGPEGRFDRIPRLHQLVLVSFLIAVQPGFVVPIRIVGEHRVGHTVALGLQRPFGEQILPFADASGGVGEVRMAVAPVRHQHKRALETVFLIHLIDPDAGAVDPVVVGQRQDALRPVFGGQDRGGAAVHGGVGRVLDRGDHRFIPSGKAEGDIVFHGVPGIGGTLGDGLGGGFDLVFVLSDDEGHDVVPRRVDVDRGIDRKLLALHILGGRGNEFRRPVVERSDLLHLGEVGLVSLRRGRHFALVDLGAYDPAPHDEPDGVGGQSVFSDHGGIGRIGVGGDDLLVPVRDLIEMLRGLPARLPRVLRSFARGDLHLGLDPVDREGDGIRGGLGGGPGGGLLSVVPSAGGEQKNGEDQQAQSQSEQSFHSKLLSFVDTIIPHFIPEINRK